MKSLTKYIKLLLGVAFIIFVSACIDPYTTPENLNCYEDEPCIVENECKTILVAAFSSISWVALSRSPSMLYRSLR